MLAQVESKSVHQEIPKLTPGCIQELTAFSVFARRSVKHFSHNFHTFSVTPSLAECPFKIQKNKPSCVHGRSSFDYIQTCTRFAFNVLLQVASLSVIGTMPAGKYSIKRLAMVFFLVISEGFPEGITRYHKIFI